MGDKLAGVFPEWLPLFDADILDALAAEPAAAFEPFRHTPPDGVKIVIAVGQEPGAAEPAAGLQQRSE